MKSACRLSMSLSLALSLALLLSLAAAGCASTSGGGGAASGNQADEEPAPAPDWAGEWVQKATPFPALTLTADSFEKRTYNSDARKEMFTGSRGGASLDGDQLTLVTNESWSTSMKWYSSKEVTTVYTLSMADGELTLTTGTGEPIVYVRP